MNCYLKSADSAKGGAAPSISGSGMMILARMEKVPADPKKKTRHDVPDKLEDRGVNILTGTDHPVPEQRIE